MKSVFKKGKVYRVVHYTGHFINVVTGRFEGFTSPGWPRFSAVPGEPFRDPVTWVRADNIVTISEVKQD